MACLLAALMLAPASRADESPSDLIDHHIFGKMQRGGVPHAPASSVKELVRAAKGSSRLAAQFIRNSTITIIRWSSKAASEREPATGGEN